MQKIKTGDLIAIMNYKLPRTGNKIGDFLLNILMKTVSYLNSIGADRAVSTDEMIKKLENEYTKMSEKKSERLKTTAAVFGKGEDLESFRMTHIHK